MASKIPSLYPEVQPQAHFLVPGDPVAQPRPRGRLRGDFIQIYTPDIVKPWKTAVMVIAKSKMPEIHGPVDVRLSFRMRRPKGHFGTGRNAGKFKASAPMHHTSKPDVDNLAKAVIDALVNSKRIDDDSNVVSLNLEKVWVESQAGVLVTIKPRE